MGGERVLVVDDEAAICRALTAGLGARGYVVTTAANGAEALSIVASTKVALVILDLGLPDIDGIEVCRRLRQWSDVPVIVLTAEGAEDRKVQALDEGADDYVTKPFSMPELLARVRVALRHRADAQAPTSSVLTVGSLRIDVADHTATMEGAPLDLTPKEFGMLVALCRHPGRLITHRSMLHEVWGPEYGTETQYLRVYASQLRKKLGDAPGAPVIVTEPGVGYRIVTDEGP